MKSKATLALLGVLLVGGLTSARAAELNGVAISGNVALATDYRFRGISQLDRSPAIQGGFDVEWENGFYIGTWASNVSFSGGAIELDVYAGFAGDINETVSYDVGFLYYAYPEDDADPSLDYYEFYGSLSFYDATIGVHYSPDYFAETDSFFYVYGAYSYALADNMTLDFHLGWNKFDGDDSFAAFIEPAPGANPGDDYMDYSVGLTMTALDLDFGLHFIGTDLSKSECFGGTKLCDDSLVFSVSKSL
ncbi:MAG: TorF family putative porin [Pseudomonadales bacterium]